MTYTCVNIGSVCRHVRTTGAFVIVSARTPYGLRSLYVGLMIAIGSCLLLGCNNALADKPQSKAAVDKHGNDVIAPSFGLTSSGMPPSPPVLTQKVSTPKK